MIKCLGLFLSCLLSAGVSFADVAGDWNADASLAQNIDSSSQGTLNSWAQNQAANNFPALPNYQANPSQEEYATNPNQMINDSTTAVNNDPNAQASITQFNQGPQYPINSGTPFVQNATNVQANAGDIIAGTYPGCNQNQQCQTTYQTKTCEYAQSQNLNCTNTLQTTVTYQPYNFDCNHIVINNFSYSEAPGPVNGMCVTGFYTANLGVSTSAPYETSGTITATLPPNVQGQVYMTLRGLDSNGDFNYGTDHFALSESPSAVLPSGSIVNPPIIGGTDGNVVWGTTTENFNTPNTGQLVNVSYNYSLQAIGAYVNGWKGMKYYVNPIVDIQPAVIYISYPYTQFSVPTVTTEWVNSCQNLPSDCTLQNETCTDSTPSKIINGTTVTPPPPGYCWQYAQNYTCNSNQPNTCSQYENTCNPVSSTCDPSYLINGVCLLYDETYSCPSQQCATQLTCGLDNFCINGNCYTDNPSQSTDFGQDDAEAAAASQAASEAANELNGGGAVQAFAGTAQDCSEAMIGFYNCCANSGWGINIGLASCTAQEKVLGEDRQTTPNLTVEVGTYCAKKVLDQCIDTHEVYCDWNGTGQAPPISNVLAYDVQIQGRQGQLGIGFGSGNSPNCSGLTMSQIQAINFNTIDFSNVSAALESEFNSNIPGGSTTETNVENEIEQQEQNMGEGQ